MQIESGIRYDYCLLHRYFPLLFLFALALLPMTGCATMETRQTTPVTVEDILKMSHDKVPAQEIIQTMRESHTVYRLKASELAKLKEKGVQDAVIDFMQQTYINAVRCNEAEEDWLYWSRGPDGYWYGGGPFQWPEEGYWPDKG